MNTPPFLVLAALVFWGGWTGLVVPGVLAGLLLEGSRLMPLRWDFRTKDFRRIWDLCVILVIGTVIYAYLAENLLNPFYSVAQWLPLLFLPMMLAQAFSERDTMPLSTFSLLLRSGRRSESEETQANISTAYFGVCLFATAATNEREEWLYAGLCGLVAWALWPHRARRFHPALWLSVFAIAAGLAYLGSVGLKVMQSSLEQRFNQWIARWIRQEIDANESQTMIGSIGRLKLSGRIVLRVDSEGMPPALLRDASYYLFKSPAWFSTKTEFARVDGGTGEGYWKLIPNRTSRDYVRIAAYLSNAPSVLALPHGTAEIDKLPVNELSTNSLGVVRAHDGPGLVRYDARYGPNASLDGAPREADLQVPDTERNSIRHIAQELQLSQKSATEVAHRLATFFEKEFTYQTYQEERRRDREKNLTPLGTFLLETRAGHCEYFATATVLLLRQAKIPARYVTGYSVQESVGPGKYLVRERHAHAWALYFDELDGGWRELDTTPGVWAAVEAANASRWEALRDFFSQVWFAFNEWRWLADRDALQRYLVWLMIPLAAVLTYRLLAANRRRRAAPGASGNDASQYGVGFDSEFFLVERHLATLGLGRAPTETFTEWLARLRDNPLFPASAGSLTRVLDLHYRYRFDPAGVTTEDREHLREEAQSWLRDVRNAPRSNGKPDNAVQRYG